MNHFKFLLILTVSAAVLDLEKSGALATVSNISENQPCLQLHCLRVAQRGDRNLSNSKGTSKKGSAIWVDPDDMVGIPKAEAWRRFILNKIYLLEGTTADDSFIVNEKANKWAVEDVSEATAGATTNSLAQIVSGNGRVGAPIQKF